MGDNSFLKKYTYKLIHIFVWLIIAMFPIAIIKSNRMDLFHIIPLYIYPVFIFIMFYLNYFVLIERYHFVKQKRWHFFAINIIIAILFSLAIQVSFEIFHELEIQRHGLSKDMMALLNIPHPWDFLSIEIGWLHIRTEKLIESFLYMIFSVVLAIFLKTLEISRRAEEEQKITELRNLQQQLSPHFLFNTLNNIYSLIAINQEKAQKAVYDLSKMLRYVLYQDRGTLVPFTEELQFIESYIQLAKLRYNSHVKVEYECLLDDIDKNREIVPLIAISLIENAFKHGVHPTKESLIKIKIERANDHYIHTEVINTFFPKNKKSDKSGSGIGLVNLRKRLDLNFGKDYTLTTEKHGDYYIASLMAPLDK